MAGPADRGDSAGTVLNDLLRAQVARRHRLSTYTPGTGALSSPSSLEYNVRRGCRDLIHTGYEDVAIVPAGPVRDRRHRQDRDRDRDR
ncbi:hypothetical protein [Streptomyces hokutonensis]|uniref:hypothetical protein n=1 Tax=Streptomyces hokutonensis TaxID=1306990 RepID=UPI00047629FF|nr:hypothetical protein [Streptomyces hokutonensis]